MASLQPEQGQPEDQGRDQQNSEQGEQSRQISFCGSVGREAGKGP